MASEKAKAIASKVRGQSVFVYAATKEDPILSADNAYKDLNAKETSSFKCSDCETHSHVVASVTPEPYCVSCGSDKMVASTEKVAATAKFVSDKEVASVTCPTCDTHNVLTASAVMASANEVHCVNCGDEVVVSSVEKASEDLDQVDTGPVGEDEFPMLAASDDEDDEAEAAGLDDGSFTEGEDFDNTLLGDDVGLEMPGNEENLFLEEYDAAVPAEGEPLMDAMELNDTPESLSLMSVGAGTVVAMKGVHTVAFANAKTAKANADLIEKPEFEKALMITAGKMGMRKALAQMGFAPITVKPVDTAAVKREVVQARSLFASEQEKKQKTFADSLALAAVGLSRNLWRGTENPLRSAIEASLTDAGVRNSKAVTSRILGEAGLEYSKTIVAVANKLAGMSEVARKEFAEMLDLVDDKAAPETASADDMLSLDGDVSDSTGARIDDAADDIDNVTSRFQKPALMLPKKQATANAKLTAGAVLAGNTPLKFNY